MFADFQEKLPGDKVSILFPMVPKLLQADERVRENIGKLAVMKGPVVYCAEEADNGKDLHLLKLLPESKIYEENVIIGKTSFPALRMAAKKQIKEAPAATLYREFSAEKYEDVEVKLIPYFAWANRGENEMMVWLRK